MAENTPYGRLEEFSPEIETFASYSERVELFLQAHAVPDDRQVAVVLNAVGVKNYSLLRGLVAPAKPSEKTVTEFYCSSSALNAVSAYSFNIIEFIK
uniref:Uncharacterized protein n=1 Tax=Amphimedon queenslandica TaxID=400682 RepID=A0A1X7TPA6_AMPQE